MLVKYAGQADIRLLSSTTLAKLGVENVADTSFLRGQSVEVPDALGTVLLNHPGLTGEFQIAGVEQPFVPASDPEVFVADPPPATE
jgi:hypothetical protein